jgi:hypothetical protein
MAEREGYHKVPRFLLQTPVVMEVDLYLYLPTNQTMIAFRQTGDQLSETDCAKLTPILDENLLTNDECKDALAAWIGNAMSSAAFKYGAAPEAPMDKGVLKSTAGALLGTFHPKFAAGRAPHGVKEQEAPPKGKDLLQEAAELVEQVLSQIKKSKSAAAYQELLQRSKGTGTDPLIAHQRQVSAMSALLLMNVGTASMDDLSDLGTAGLVHDLGLAEITQSLRERHLIGEDLAFNPSEKLIYLRHTDLAVDRLKAQSFRVTPQVLQIIQQHHESWDGSGFKGLPGPQTCAPARALRIADDLVAWMSNDKNSGNLVDAQVELSKRGPIYDPAILQALRDSLV